MLSPFSRVQHFATLWAVAGQAPLSMRFSRPEYWSGLPCPLPDPGIEPASPALQADSLPTEPPGKCPYAGRWAIIVPLATWPSPLSALPIHSSVSISSRKPSLIPPGIPGDLCFLPLPYTDGGTLFVKHATHTQSLHCAYVLISTEAGTMAPHSNRC